MSSIDVFLSPSQIHVWAIGLRAPNATHGAYRALLLATEKAQAQKLAFEHLQRSYEVSHGVLRLLLAQYVKCRPQQITYEFGPEGKPSLQGDSPIRFNMSHSGNLGLYAFTTECEVGIDVEEVRKLPDIEQIASHYFCASEINELLSTRTTESRQNAFFRCWTRKEAYIKAVGGGLNLPLDRFQVTLLADAPARFVSIGNDRLEASQWNLHHLEPASGYIGALAYRSVPHAIIVWRFLDAQELLNQIVKEG